MRRLLNEQQARAYDMVLNGENVFLTGAGGVGKSFTIQAIVDQLENLGREVRVAATTGAAAILIGGQTVHRLLGIGLGSGTAQYLAQQIAKNPRKAAALQTWRCLQVLVIDEISMMDAELFDKLEHMARLLRRNGKPFGGIQVVLCGDFAQLPPVKAKGGFSFEAKSWPKVVPPSQYVELREIIRQSDKVFGKALDEIRFGIISPETIRLLRSRVGAKVGTDSIKPTILYSRRANVARKNLEELSKIANPIMPFRCSDRFFPYWPREKTRKQIIDKMNQNMQAREMVELKTGAQVMLIHNMSDQLVNGSRGVITHFDAAGLPVVAFMNGITTVIEKHKWKVKVDEKLWFEREQIPLILAWACTTHKSQGATLDCVEIDISRCFEHGQAYVALSRVKSIEGLSLKSSDLSRITAHPKVKKFYEEIRNPEGSPSKKRRISKE